MKTLIFWKLTEKSDFYGGGGGGFTKNQYKGWEEIA